MNDGLPTFREGFAIAPQLTARAMNAIVAAIRRNRINPGPNQLLDQSNGGTQVWNRRGSGLTLLFPFQPFATDLTPGSRKITFRPGWVNCYVPTIDGVEINADPPPQLSVADGARVAYIELSYDDQLVVNAAEIKEAASVPSNAISYTSPATSKSYIRLCDIQASGNLIWYVGNSMWSVVVPGSTSVSVTGV